MSTQFAFLNVEASISPGGPAIIEWRLNRLFKFASYDLKFYIDFARTAGEWTRLNPDHPVTNVCWYIDEINRRCSLQQDMYYRVAVNDGQAEYLSMPADTLGVLSRHDWLIARDVVRKEYLRLKKYVGAPGFLLKRREYGPRCTACTDPDVGDVVNSSCPICYGTGVIGGYYNALPFFVDMTGPTSAADVTSPFGTTDNLTRLARAVAYPQVHTYDVWIGDQTNVRYIIRKVQNAVEMRGKPLVLMLDLNQLAGSAVEQTVPLDQPPTPSPGMPIEEVAEGWRQGIARQEL